jgi:hypothetical protein
MPKLLIAVLLACIVSSAAAQAAQPAASLRPAWAHAVWSPLASKAQWDKMEEPLGGFLGPGDEDHRYPGFFVGAGLGLAATTYALSMCEGTQSDCASGRTLLLGAGLSAMVGLAGAVVGGLIPK